MWEADLSLTGGICCSNSRLWTRDISDSDSKLSKARLRGLVSTGMCMTVLKDPVSGEKRRSAVHISPSQPPVTVRTLPCLSPPLTVMSRHVSCWRNQSLETYVVHRHAVVYSNPGLADG